MSDPAHGRGQLPQGMLVNKQGGAALHHVRCVNHRRAVAKFLDKKPEVPACLAGGASQATKHVLHARHTSDDALVGGTYCGQLGVVDHKLAAQAAHAQVA